VEAEDEVDDEVDDESEYEYEYEIDGAAAVKGADERKRSCQSILVIVA